MKSATIIATVSAVAISGINAATQPQRKRTNNKRRQINNAVPAKVETEKYDPFLGLPSDVETQQYNERKLQETAEMSLPLDLSDGTDAPVATPAVTTDAPVAAAPGVDTPVPTSWYPTYIPTAGSNDFAAAQGGVENGSSSISVGVTLLLGGVGVWMNMN